MLLPIAAGVGKKSGYRYCPSSVSHFCADSTQICPLQLVCVPREWAKTRSSPLNSHGTSSSHLVISRAHNSSLNNINGIGIGINTSRYLRGSSMTFSTSSLLSAVQQAARRGSFSLSSSADASSLRSPSGATSRVTLWEYSSFIALCKSCYALAYLFVYLPCYQRTIDRYLLYLHRGLFYDTARSFPTDTVDSMQSLIFLPTAGKS